MVVNADQAGQVGQSVSVGADEISEQASKLRVEVDQFLHAIQTDAGERRDYERLDGNGIMVNVQLHGRPAKQVMLVNMSRSGIAVGFREQVPAGTDIEVTMPGDRTPMPGRVVRTAPDGGMAIVFRQDDATLERVDQVLATVRTSLAA